MHVPNTITEVVVYEVICGITLKLFYMSVCARHLSTARMVPVLETIGLGNSDG
jgi:hypothetical protein